jgi:hypothetical protein
MFQYLALVALGAVILSTTIGSAASLGVTSGGSIGAGNDTVAACDSDGVSSGYSVVWDTTAQDYVVKDVTVSGIDAACDGSAMNATIAGSSGAKLAEKTAAHATGATEIFTFTSDAVLAANVTKIVVAIAK